MSSQNEIYFNFSYYALNLLGKQMYTNKWSAISELVANGLDADAKNVKVYINSIDKKNSTIEIIDNGIGMSYDDLVNKYALIGRNKREMEANIENTTKGRKGIGKLAALYLSKKYYIITKHKNVETAWVLDSNNAKDSEVPRLDRVKYEETLVENDALWKTYTQGTILKLTNVDMTYFAEQRLEGLKNRIADYYLLDNLHAKIEIAYIIDEKSKKNIQYFPAEKRVAFKNFYSFFETKKKLMSGKLGDKVYIKPQQLSEVETAKSVVVLTPNEISSPFDYIGEKKFTNLKGKEELIKYELKGWIGIHSTINEKEARKLNDDRFLKNNVYTPNRLKLYIRDKLAVENFLEYIGNTQAFVNNIEGEISFDLLDDDRLPDISSTSREGLTKDDERVQLLVRLVNKVVNKLITDRSSIGSKIRKEENDVLKRLEEEKLRLEKEAKEKAQKEQEAAELKRKQAEEEKKKLNEENKSLQEENKSLGTQNKMKDIILSGSDSKMQDLLVHELTGVSNKINSAVFSLAREFKKTGEYDRIQKHLINFKKSANKLSTIKHQFLKLNDYDVIGQQNIELKRYLRSYFENVENKYIKEIKLDRIEHSNFNVKVDIFELGVLLDNIILNIIEESAIKNRYSTVEVIFIDGANEFHIISDTGPITISPVEKIFELGVSSKKNGTGIGMYLCKEICNKFHWGISVSNRDELVDFTITLEE